MVDGVDVSTYQGDVDWHQVPGVLGIAKATEGTLSEDDKFQQNWSGMVFARKRPGAYHFIRCQQNWIVQADAFLSVALTNNPASILALDLEPYPKEAWCMGPDETVANAVAWLEHVHQQTGVLPWLYTYPSFMGFLSAASSHTDLAAYPLWWADPSDQNPAPWAPALVQYGQDTVPGINGAVDVNRLGPAYNQTLPLPKGPLDVHITYSIHNAQGNEVAVGTGIDGVLFGGVPAAVVSTDGKNTPIPADRYVVVSEAQWAEMRTQVPSGNPLPPTTVESTVTSTIK